MAEQEQGDQPFVPGQIVWIELPGIWKPGRRLARCRILCEVRVAPRDVDDPWFQVQVEAIELADNGEDYVEFDEDVFIAPARYMSDENYANWRKQRFIAEQGPDEGR